MICTNCGKEIQDGATFCPYCGALFADGLVNIHYEAHLDSSSETLPVYNAETMRAMWHHQQAALSDGLSSKLDSMAEARTSSTGAPAPQVNADERDMDDAAQDSYPADQSAKSPDEDMIDADGDVKAEGDIDADFDTDFDDRFDDSDEAVDAEDTEDDYDPAAEDEAILDELYKKALRFEAEERRRREEAERKAREEAEARAEAERKAREEAERKAREEAEARAEAERIAREEAEQKAREEEEARVEAERKAQEEAEAQAKKDAERAELEEAMKQELLNLASHKTLETHMFDEDEDEEDVTEEASEEPAEEATTEEASEESTEVETTEETSGEVSESVETAEKTEVAELTEEENAEEKSEVTESAEESAEEHVEESAEESAEEHVEESAEESAEEHVEESAEESAEEPSVNSAEETGEELSEEPADESVEEPVENSTEMPAEGETERITEASSEEISEEKSEEAEKAEEDETSESAEVIQIADHLSEKDEEKHLDGSDVTGEDDTSDEEDVSDETTSAGAEEATTSEKPAGKSKKGLKITVLVIAVMAVAWGVWYQLPSTKASRIRKQAEQAYAAADYADAAAAYQQLMGYGAQSEKICLHAVDAYADAGDHAEALALLQSSIERYPDSSALKDELEKLNPTVHFDPEGGSFTDPVTIQMRSEGTEQIRYSIEREGASAKSEEIEYATPAELRYSGSYTVRAHGIAKDGEAGDEFTQHYEIKLDPNKYHLDDWNETADGVQYLDAEGRFLTGWQTIDEKKYYFDENGYRATGKTDIDRDSYFFDADGVMQTGWQQDDDGWYFFDETGKMLRDVWIEDTYYVDSDGKMLMDTTTPDGTKVDANGRKISDLAKIFEEHPDAMVVIQSADRKNEGEYSTFPAKAYYKHTSDKPEGDAYDTTVRISNHAWLHYIDKNLPRALVTDAYRFLPHIGILKPTIDENGIITEFDFILGSQG